MNLYERRAFLNGDDGEQYDKLVTRQRICLHEIWDEIIDGRNKLDDKNARIIRDCMLSIDGWRPTTRPHRYGKYGVQRLGYERYTKLEELSDALIEEILNN